MTPVRWLLPDGFCLAVSGLRRQGLNDNIAYEALDGTTLSEVRLTAIALKQRKHEF